MRKVIMMILALSLAFGMLYASDVTSRSARALPYAENFDTGTLAAMGWAVERMDLSVGSGVGGSTSLRGNVWSSGRISAGTTPLIGPITADALVEFEYRVINFTGGAATTLHDSDQFTVEYAITNAHGVQGPWENFATITGAEHAPSTDFTLFSEELPGTLVGQNVSIRIRFERSISSTIDAWFIIDNFRLYTPQNYDLWARSITGPVTLLLNAPAVYNVTITNDGLLEATGYDIHIMQFGNDTPLATVAGTALDPGATTAIPVTWTPTVLGPVSIYGLVDWDLDTIAANDVTPLRSVDVQPADFPIIAIGNGTTSSNVAPISYFYRSSVAQTIYLSSEIPTGGLITEMQYDFTRSADNPPGNAAVVEFYMANVPAAMTSFTSTTAWVPLSEFTQVFSGVIAYPSSGQQFVNIVFDEPFVYTGENLVIMGFRPHDPDWYANANQWRTTVIAGSNRTIRNYSDTEGTFTLQNPATGSSNQREHFIPNVKLYFDATNLGTLSGTITDGATPLENVRVALNGTTRAVYTDADGEYTIPYIPVSTDVNITATKHGYAAYTNPTPLVIEDGDTTTHSFAMTLLPLVNVSGTIFKSDAPTEGIVGATVTLTGYDDYTATSVAGGAFSIPDVFANQTYALRITYDGYQEYTDEIVVGATALIIPPITMLERATPPASVVATPNAANTEVNLTWNAPGLAMDVWFSHYTHASAVGPLGAQNNPFTFEVQQRYTEAQLVQFGVSGAELTTVSFIPWVTGSNQFTIRIYTGGSGSPYNPGTLIYEQPVPVADLTEQVWNEITLTTPVPIPTTGEMWIGYQAVQITDVPVGRCAGPALDGFGNVIHWGGAWGTLLGMAPTMPFNWAIRNMASGASGPVMFTHTDYSEVGFTSFADAYARHSSHTTTEAVDFSNFSTTAIHAANDIAIVSGGSRASAERSGTIQTPTTPNRALVNYQIKRANVLHLGDESLWTTIQPTWTDTTLVDASWATAPSGEYRYVVRARYTNDVLSVPAFSNIVSKDMESPVNITVNTVDGGVPTGAVVRLVNNSGNTAHIYTTTLTAASNVAAFPAVWHGTYTLTITRAGYHTHVDSSFEIDGPTNETITLGLSLVLLSEGFEGTTFPPTGWTMTPTAGHTWWRAGTDAATNGVAWFSGGAPVYVQPNTGAGMATSASYDQANDAALSPNNWLITPQINVPLNTESLTLKYWVRSVLPEWQDNYGVYVSETGTATGTGGTTSPGDVVGDFTLLFYETAPAPNPASQTIWFERTVNLEGYAGTAIYIAFRHFRTTDMFNVLIDDIELTYAGGEMPMGTLSGIVTAGTPPAPLAGATVTIATTTHTATTDINGLYTIPSVIAGNIVVNATAEGHDNYTSAGTTVTITAGQTTTHNIHLAKTDDIDITAIPMITELRNNYPNPFNPSTLIAFDVAKAENVTIEVYNIRGQKVRTLVNDHYAPGKYSVVWYGDDDNGREVASGVYFYKMSTDSYSNIKKMLLMK